MLTNKGFITGRQVHSKRDQNVIYGTPRSTTKIYRKELITYQQMYTVKLEMFADINVCEFAILKVFALLKFAILVLPKVNFVFPTNSVLLLLLLIGYIR